MRFVSPRTARLGASALLLVTGSALAATQLDATSLGWTPLVSMWGRGDAGRAVKSLREVTQAYDSVLHRTEIDAPTQKFIDKALDQLEDFDLDGFYDLLPEPHAEFRELRVRGDLAGKRYLVRRATDAGYEVGLDGPRRELAAMSMLLHARPGHDHGEHKSFLLGGRVGLGIGPLSFRALIDAAEGQLRLASTGDPRAQTGEALPAPTPETRTKVKALHPGLGEEDVEVVALLFEAFPALGQTLATFGRVEDVRVARVGAAYQHVTARVRALPERIKGNYPDLGKHLGKLGDLARADVRWVDSQGRTLAALKADTKELTLAVDCYVKDGKLLPFRRDTVFADEPVELMGAALAHTRLLVDARLEMLGVVIKLDKLKLDVAYEARETYGSIGASFTSVPGVRVEGRALGFLPTGLVDAFIPGNMESLTRDFFDVAARGNGGKGAVLHLDVGSASEGKEGVLALSADVEALDNFLVKMGVGVVNDRVMPSDDAIEDGERFAGALHDAFVRDLSRFQGKVGG